MAALLRRVKAKLRSQGPRGLIAAATRVPLAYVAALRLRRRLRHTRPTGVSEAVDLANRLRSGPLSIAPLQARAEIEQLLGILEERRPRTLLEIGTANGGTLFLLCRVAAPDALLVSVDLEGGAFGDRSALAFLCRGFARDRQRVEPVFWADSHDPATLGRVRSLLGGRELDFLLIDGDHSYQGVQRDFEMYGGLVRPGGLIALHDIVPGPAEHVGGVPDFWRELKHEHETQELVASWDQGAFGIGLLTVR